MDIKWKDRKRIIFGLPWSFTLYSLDDERLFIKTGFLNTNEDEVRLYRITDISLSQKLSQRIFGIGTIKCCSADKTMKDFEIKNIKHPSDVKAMLSDFIEAQRDAKRVSSREFLDDPDDIDDDDN